MHIHLEMNITADAITAGEAGLAGQMSRLKPPYARTLEAPDQAHLADAAPTDSALPQRQLSCSHTRSQRARVTVEPRSRLWPTAGAADTSATDVCVER